jgi:hypothetical protein
MTTQLDTFETRLLAELRDRVALADSPRRTTSRWVAGAAVATAAALAGVVLLPGLGTNPAFSVQQGNAGEIDVEVHRLEDAPGLEAALAEHGVAADIRYLPWGQACAPGRYTPVDRSLSGMGVSMGSSVLRVVLPPGAVRDDEVLVMWVSGAEMTMEELSAMETEEGVTTTSGFQGRVQLDVTTAPVAPCEVVPARD